MAKSNVSCRCCAYSDMSDSWTLIHDLLGGTRAMRLAGVRWLPKEPAETQPDYDNRLNRSILFNGLKDAISRVVSLPFSMPVTLSGNLPETISFLEKNCDATGKDLSQFAREVFQAGVTYGGTHILVDYPKVQGTVTIEEEQRAGLQPVFIHIPPCNLISWESKVVGRQRVLTEIRFIEYRTERKEGDEYADVQNEYIRVYRETTWELWAKKGEDWIKVDEGTHTFGRIPLVTIPFSPIGYMTFEPPFEDLAWVNLAHWQSMSDQRNILRFARCGILFGKGMDDEAISKIVIGPNHRVGTPNENADLKYVEYGGKALEAGEADVSKLEEKMEHLGMRPLQRRTSPRTATEGVIDEKRSLTDAQAWIGITETGLESACRLAAEWKKTKVDEKFRVVIFSDFAIGSAPAAEITELRNWATTTPPLASQELVLKEAKRRGFFADDLDVTEEIERTQSQLSFTPETEPVVATDGE